MKTRRGSVATRMSNYQRGMWAEYVAIVYLWLHGYWVLRHRYRSHTGEIDIIAKRGKLLVFVEVKLRKDIVSALESISHRQQQRMQATAECFIRDNRRYQDYAIRLDVMAFSRRPLKWRYLKNVIY